MDYKALEDLINILVKKAGTNLSEETVSTEVLRLEEKKKKLIKEKDKFVSMFSSKEYSDVISREKDENEKQYLTKLISELEKELQSLNIEAESFNKVMESGESFYDTLVSELCRLQKELKKMQIKTDMSIENNEKLNSDYLELKNTVKDKMNSLMRKKVLEEEIVRIISEINETKESLKIVSSRIEMSSYDNNLIKTNDEDTLKNLEEEIKLLDDSIEIWKTHPQILGGKVLDAFKSKNDQDSVKREIDTLISMANSELKRTQEEINGSNIFELMDKYDQAVIKLKDSIGSSDYNDESMKKTLSIREEYHKDKVLKNRNSLSGIDIRKNEVLNLISISKNLCEDVRQSRLELEYKLFNLENKLFLENTREVSEEELRSIDKLIGDIKKDIEDYKLLESKYVEDIYSYKEEIKNLDINYNTLEKETLEEEKIINVITSRLNDNGIFVNTLKMLEDKLNLIEYKNRVSSLKHQQQYLYVDSKVIRDEINHLWNRSEKIVVEDNKEETIESIENIEVEVIEPEEVFQEEKTEALLPKDENIENSKELIDECKENELEVLDDFDFEN